jgi:hypothetical protein
MILSEIIKDAQHIRRFAWARLGAAFVITVLGTLGTTYLAGKGIIGGGAMVSGSAATSVVGLLLADRVTTFRNGKSDKLN